MAADRPSGRRAEVRRLPPDRGRGRQSRPRPGPGAEQLAVRRPLHAGPDERRAVLHPAVPAERADDRRCGRSRGGGRDGSAVPVGATVSHFEGWREFALLDAAKVQPLDVTRVPPQAYLGVLGITGLTAYVGLTEIAPVKEGDIVFISGAAGAVGSVAGQIAKKLGRVEGHRLGRRAGEGEAAQGRLRLRRRDRLPRGRAGRAAEAGRAGRDRRVLRQRRRRHPRRGADAHEPVRADRAVRRDLGLQRGGPAARAAPPAPGDRQEPEPARVHHRAPHEDVPGVHRQGHRVAGGRLAARRRDGRGRDRQRARTPSSG